MISKLDFKKQEYLKLELLFQSQRGKEKPVTRKVIENLQQENI